MGQVKKWAQEKDALPKRDTREMERLRRTEKRKEVKNDE